MIKWAKVEYGEGTIEALAEMGIDAEKEVNRALAKNYIIQLAEQAGWMMGDEPEGFNTRLEKFAELIVREAIGVLQKRFMGDLNREDMEVRRCVEDVKEHFGVK